VGKTRVCGKRCHAAKCAKCRCWCGGLFHGAAGLQAREAFKAEFMINLPTTERAFDALTRQPELFDETGKSDRWRSAIAAARGARLEAGV
jgi:hypothetical protein